MLGLHVRLGRSGGADGQYAIESPTQSESSILSEIPPSLLLSSVSIFYSSYDKNTP